MLTDMQGLKDVFANWIVFGAAFSACMGGLLFGFDQGILSLVYVMPRFLKQFPEIDSTSGLPHTGLNKGLMTGLLELGAFLGAFQSGFLADRFSRKRTIGIGAIWFIVGSILQTTAFSYGHLTAGRFIGGVGIGLLSSTAPMYISEISPPNCRGAFLVLEGSSIVIGVVVMFYITYGTQYIPNSWCFRLPFLLQITPCVILVIGLWLLPYSPRWQVQVGRDQEALESLCRLRKLPATDPRIQAEWITMRADAIQAREVVVATHPRLVNSTGFAGELKLELAGWVDLFRPGVLNRTIIGIFLMLFQQFQGINALVYYSPTLFGELGLDTKLQIDLSGVLNIIQMIATCSAFFLLDRVGRKPPLIFGSIGNACSHFIVAGLIGKYQGKWDDHPAAAWTGVAFILYFMFSFGIGWSPVPWAIPAEISATSRRAKTVGLSVIANWLFNFIIGLITPPMIASIKYGTFIFFGAFSFMSLFWTIFFCPETKGKTLEDMDILFHTNAAHEERLARADIIALVCGSQQSAAFPRSGEKFDSTEHVEIASQV